MSPSPEVGERTDGHPQKKWKNVGGKKKRQNEQKNQTKKQKKEKRDQKTERNKKTNERVKESFYVLAFT